MVAIIDSNSHGIVICSETDDMIALQVAKILSCRESIASAIHSMCSKRPVRNFRASSLINSSRVFTRSRMMRCIGDRLERRIRIECRHCNVSLKMDWVTFPAKICSSKRSICSLIEKSCGKNPSIKKHSRAKIDKNRSFCPPP